MLDHFQAGANLGGWISQYHDFDPIHFQTFIREKDIRQIASWGMDHVRLPVDYPVLEWEDEPLKYREDGFQYIDRCVEWCAKFGLGVMIDLHRAPGYTFTNTLEPGQEAQNNLFSDEAAQQRFIALWQTIARRYLSAPDSVVLELLNEVVLPDSAPWNALAHRTVAAIHEIDPQRVVIVGGNQYNAASELKNLTLFDDPRVAYTFHFYEPLLFTHQKAPWSRQCRLFNRALDYPGAHLWAGQIPGR